MIWLGQSARTTVVTREYPELANKRWMVSLGDAIHRPRMLDTVFGPNLKDRLAIDGPLMIDSGGFTNMTQGGGLRIEQVARAFSSTNAEVAVSLDLPPLASDTEQVRLFKYRQTTENYARLVESHLGPLLAPVLHGINPEELGSNCEATAAIERNPTWICLGGLVPLLRKSGGDNNAGFEARKRLDGSIRLVRASFPQSKLHVLGVGSPRNVSMAFAAGADSVDSIGWRRAAGFGTIFMPAGTERFVAPRDRKRAKSRKYLTEADHAALAVCGCPPCRRLTTLSLRLDVLGSSYLARAAHNAWALLTHAGNTVSASNYHGGVEAAS